MSKSLSGGEKATLTVVAVLLVLLVLVVIYGLLGLVAAGLVSLIFRSTGFDSGMSFMQLWLASGATVFILQCVANMFSGKKVIEVKRQ